MNRSNKAPFKAYCYSKNGKEKYMVPDSHKYKRADKENEDFCKADSYKGIFITADGLGGHEGAKEASQHATIFLYNKLVSVYRLMKMRDLNDHTLHNLLNNCVMKTNDCIESWSKLSHMSDCGTTIDAIILSGNKLHGAHVGDGSVYKIDVRENKLKILTNINKQIVTPGNLSELETNLVNFGTVFNPLGRKNVSLQTYSETLNDSDIILMSTDGLTKKVHPEEILASFYGKDFAAGVKTLKHYCRKPEKMKEIISNLEKDYDVNQDMLFFDDTTFITIRRND